MADDTPTVRGPFDVDTVRHLVRLMARFDLSEIDLHDGERRIRLRRGGVSAPSAVAAPPPPAVHAATTVPAPPQANELSATAASNRKGLEIKSPMVGTFYAKPAPDKEDYVKMGSRITADTVVCKIEAMKIFNDLPAGCSGTISEVLAENGQFVEYDQVLFRVDPS